MLYKCYKSDQMNVNLHLRGELEKFINDLVNRGIAANKTEAIRLAISKYYDEMQQIKSKMKEELPSQSTIEAHWNNPSDEKSAEFYAKRYLNARKA